MTDFENKEEPSDGKDKLDEKIKDLWTICSEIQDTVCTGNKQQPHWSVCVNKLQTCYARVGNSEGFREMFTVFHDKYSEYYTDPIFTYKEDDEDGVVNDSFFTSEKIFKGPGRIGEKEVTIVTKKRGSTWAKKPVLKGPVIYFTYEEEKSSTICIPLGEIYRTAVNLYEDMEEKKNDDSNIRSLPARLLLIFYKVILEACGESCVGAQGITNNIIMLEETVADVTEDGGKSTSSSGPFGVLKDIFKKVLPTLTKEGGKDMPKDLQKSLNNVMEGDTLDDIGTIFTEFGSSIEKGAAKAAEDGKQKGGRQSVVSMLGTISEALQSETIVGKMEGIAGKLGQFTDGGALAPPSKLVEPVVSADACEQD